MDTKKIVEKAYEIANFEASKLGLKICDIEYVKENGIKILRILAEGEESLDIDEATALNNAISEAIDIIPDNECIEEEYYLEVSSCGLEKELKKDEDIFASIGKYICIRTYEKVDGLKEIYGDLADYSDGVLTINYLVKTQRKQIKIQKEKISKIRLAVRF